MKLKKSTVIDFPDKYVEIGSARSPEIGPNTEGYRGAHG